MNRRRTLSRVSVAGAIVVGATSGQALPAGAVTVGGRTEYGFGLARAGTFTAQVHNHGGYDGIHASILVSNQNFINAVPLGCTNYQARIQRINKDGQAVSNFDSPRNIGSSLSCYFSGEFESHYGTAARHNHYLGDNKFAAYWRDTAAGSQGNWIKLPGAYIA